MKKIKIVFCWPQISGYVTDCWREIAKNPKFAVEIIAFQPDKFTHSREGLFSERLLENLNCTLLNEQERNNSDFIERLVKEKQAEVIVIAGWMHPPFNRLVSLPSFRGNKFIMTMDTPWWGNLRQYAALILLRKYARKFHLVVTNGERAWQYAWRLGIPQQKIRQGTFGIDYKQLAGLYEQRAERQWPQSFLYVGRYVEAKALDILIAAYQKYRQQVEQPWKLICCGNGPLENLLTTVEGIENRGFIQPFVLANIWREAGIFVLPSRVEPWGVVLVEACAAGLPVIATTACGATVEVVRDYFNGRIIPPNDVESLAEAMREMHTAYAELPKMGKNAQQLAAPYSLAVWAKRWENWIEGLFSD